MAVLWGVAAHCNLFGVVKSSWGGCRAWLAAIRLPSRILVFDGFIPVPGFGVPAHDIPLLS